MKAKIRIIISTPEIIFCVLQVQDYVQDRVRFKQRRYLMSDTVTPYASSYHSPLFVANEAVDPKIFMAGVATVPVLMVHTTLTKQTGCLSACEQATTKIIKKKSAQNFRQF